MRREGAGPAFFATPRVPLPAFGGGAATATVSSSVSPQETASGAPSDEPPSVLALSVSVLAPSEEALAERCSAAPLASSKPAQTGS